MKDVLAVVLAGGKGARLGPLTRDRAKPAVPFGGIYRIVELPSQGIAQAFQQIRAQFRVSGVRQAAFQHGLHGLAVI
ncbi:MAG: sugar phosphate nucleotidyltransferase, partial [Candidatus Udaeobacter sp.]